MADEPKRHMCHCGKGFLRKEHLRRHQASHGERAFVCHVCSRSFTRSDLLRRHVALHNTSVVPEPRRGRACDACHTNKTKCDGGQQCSLCTKRSIECTYNRGAAATSAQEEPPTSRSSATSNGTTADSPPLQLGSLPPRSARLSYTASSSSASSDQSPLFSSNGHHDMAVVDSSISTAGYSKHDAGVSCLSLIIEAVQACHDSASETTLPSSSPAVKEWLAECVQRFTVHFHERWQVLHTPTWEEMTDGLLLLATTTIIGAWLEDDGVPKEMVAEVYGVVVQRIVEDLVRITLKPRDRWPVQTYQAAVLNIAFAFETGRDDLIPRARLLNNLLITALRGDRALSTEGVEHQRAAFYPGDFAPYVLAYNESFKKLAIAAFRVDAYLSLSTGDLPILQNDEMQIALPSTFAVYNAYGLDIFYRRYPSEPLDRGLYKICDMTAMISQQSLPTVVLFEDLQLGLLSVTKDIAIMAQSKRGHQALLQPNDPQRGYLSSQLEVFQDYLDQTVTSLTSTGFQSRGAKALLAAYSGREEPGDQNWRNSTMARIWSHVFLTAMLYHILNLQLYTNVEMIKSFVLEQATAPYEGAGLSPRQQRRAVQVQEWAYSQDGRSAVLHAVSALRVCEQSLALAASRDYIIDPLILTSLSVSTAVVWAWAMSEQGPCTCAHSLHSVDFGSGPLSGKKRPEIEAWIHSGGPANLQGVPLCKTTERAWLLRFNTAMTRGARAWDLNTPLVTALRSRSKKA